MKFENYFTEKYKLKEINPDEGSQHGEEGIINELFKRLNITSGWLVDAGAWNGKVFSNIFQLIITGKFKAIDIEANEGKFPSLLETAKEYPNIIPIRKSVDYKIGFPDRLDNILKETPIPKDFDVLVIDTDFYDYQIWEEFKMYNPKLVIIEANQNIEGEYIHQAAHPNRMTYGDGSSFLAILELGQRKGYTYLGHLSSNTFWIRNDLAPKLGDLLLPDEELKAQIINHSNIKKFIGPRGEIKKTFK